MDAGRGHERWRVRLRPLTRADLPQLSRWLRQERVARWWADDPDPAALERQYGPGLDGRDPTEVFVVVAAPEGAPPGAEREAGIVQRYRYGDEPASRAELAAVLPVPAEALGIDYLIGEADLQGRGLGPALIAAVVADGWRRHPDAPEVLVAVAAGNRASWRSLQQAGFTLAAEGELEPDNPVDGPEHVVLRLRRPAP